MAATVEIDESNGVTETITHGITKTDWGAVDAPNLDSVANRITPGQNSFEKWQRLHLTNLGGSAAILNLKFWASAPAANATHNFNGSTVQGTYDGANHKQTVYAQPATTSTRTPEAVLTAQPGSANLGIAGSLSAQLTAVGFSDYLLHQIRLTSSATAGTTMTVNYGYEEIA